jgi:hypothetical protein
MGAVGLNVPSSSIKAFRNPLTCLTFSAHMTRPVPLGAPCRQAQGVRVDGKHKAHELYMAAAATPAASESALLGCGADTLRCLTWSNTERQRGTRSAGPPCLENQKRGATTPHAPAPSRVLSGLAHAGALGHAPATQRHLRAVHKRVNERQSAPRGIRGRGVMVKSRAVGASRMGARRHSRHWHLQAMP